MANSHKRETNARRIPKPAFIAAPIAVLATASAVTLGVLDHAPAVPSMAIDSGAPEASASASADTGAQRDSVVSRSGVRFERKPTPLEVTMAPAAVKKAVKNADTRLWTDGELNLWTSPAERAKQRGVVDEGKKVLVTGRSLMGREEIVVDGQPRWVTSGYLVKEKPPTLGGECTNGTSVPSAVAPGIAAVHRAVCANFPEISSYGTFRSGGGDHGSGRAVDIMVSGDRGWEVAEFVRANAGAFDLNYAIYSQQIFSMDRSGEGWRGMSDRGSATANHYDHVHVSVY